MEAYIGTVMIFAGNFAPQGWFDCAGQILPIQQYAALYSLLGNTYGGNGTTTFALPDLRGRIPVGGGMGQAGGLSNYALGQVGGTETVTLNTNQIPAHTHAATQANSTVSGGSISGVTANLAASQNGGGHETAANGDYLAQMQVNGSDAVSAYIAPANKGTTVNLGGLSVSGGSITGATVTNGAITNAQTGGNQPHPNVQPYLGIRYIICANGIYPSRP